MNKKSKSEKKLKNCKVELDCYLCYYDQLCSKWEAYYKPRVEELEKILKLSEQWREYYREGKLKLYSYGGEIAKATMKHLPCNEGYLESKQIELLKETMGWIELSEYKKLRQELQSLKTRKLNKDKIEELLEDYKFPIMTETNVYGVSDKVSREDLAQAIIDTQNNKEVK